MWNSSERSVIVGAACSSLPFTVNMVQYVPSFTAYLVTLFTCVFNGISCSLTFLANLLVFAAILRKMELQTAQNISILFLAATDLLVALIAQPSFLVFQASKVKDTNGFSCHALAVYTTAVFICSGLSIVTVILITLERYFAIFYPFNYQRFVTKSKSVFFISLVWSVWVFFVCYIRFKPGTNTTILSTIASVLILTCFGLTAFVYFKVQKLVRRVHSEATRTEQEHNNNTGNRLSDTKSSKTVGLIACSLVLCLLPTLLTSIVYQVKVVNKNYIYHIIYPITDSFIFLSSSLNPVIYVFRSSRVRSSMKQMLKRN
ncbi:beta-2 adrenergic receptor-like [Nematostella vectensis]|uniref:beta-2 adrenergic receptor-like n=1 Tax=Nematostella vectensis TaxID=45351 RepID=UPI002077624A|nr:beta-2 adrenergic receptor-like [Nematostella vectensis]